MSSKLAKVPKTSDAVPFGNGTVPRHWASQTFWAKEPKLPNAVLFGHRTEAMAL